jgi:hypothetical protein
MFLLVSNNYKSRIGIHLFQALLNVPLLVDTECTFRDGVYFRVVVGILLGQPLRLLQHLRAPAHRLFST